jgi:hypothetical protein
MRKLAAGLLQGVPFSEREWSGKIRNFRAVQDEFEKRELVRTKGKQRILNGRGRRLLLEYYYRNSSPSAIPNLGLKSMRDG